jgi:hypothetical protein
MLYVKVVLSVLCFRLFANVFILKTENKSEKENSLANKALRFCNFSALIITAV